MYLNFGKRTTFREFRVNICLQYIPIIEIKLTKTLNQIITHQIQLLVLKQLKISFSRFEERGTEFEFSNNTIKLVYEKVFLNLQFGIHSTHYLLTENG